MSPKGEEANKTAANKTVANKTVANKTSANKTEAILEVRNLVKHFQIGGGLFGGRAATVKAGDGVSFSLHRGETLGPGGDAGSGKTTNRPHLLRPEGPTYGAVNFLGTGKSRLSDTDTPINTLT